MPARVSQPPGKVNFRPADGAEVRLDRQTMARRGAEDFLE